MYGLYDKEGILRFVNSDKDACIAYAELFELGSTNYCLMDLANDTKKVKGNTNPVSYTHLTLPTTEAV